MPKGKKKVEEPKVTVEESTEIIDDSPVEVVEEEVHNAPAAKKISFNVKTIHGNERSGNRKVHMTKKTITRK